MDPEKVCLVVLDGKKTHELNLDARSVWTIGRDTDNVFAFQDTAMSRRHAMIQQVDDGRFYFTDLGSRNGSIVNGRRVTGPTELHNGDSLVCGGTELIFRAPASAPRAPVPQAKPSAETHVLYARRFLTTLVVDIRDFTPLSRRLDGELLAQVMGAWFRETHDIVTRLGSSGDKFIGDAVMAVWTHHSEKPAPAEIWPVLAAVHDIQVFTASLQKQFDLPSPVHIGAGINTGVSIVSNVGTQDNPEFSPLGDNVNAAFRLESATKQSGYDVALGRATFECLGGGGDLERFFENRPIELKGYENVVDTLLTSFANLAILLDRRK